MKKILKVFLFVTIFSLVSCSDDSSEYSKPVSSNPVSSKPISFKPVKLVFNGEKHQQILFFKNKAKAELTEEEKKIFYKKYKEHSEDDFRDNDYILFESEKFLKIPLDNNEAKTFEYKFEDGLLKLLHEGQFHPYAFGTDVKKISFIVMGEYYLREDGSGGFGSTGEFEEYMLLPFNFESTKNSHGFKLEDITGERKLFLFKDEYIYTAQ